MKQRLEPVQAENFVRNTFLLIWNNNISSMNLMRGITKDRVSAKTMENRFQRMMEEPYMEHVEPVAQFFEEEVEDMLDIDYRKWTVNTLQKEHLKRFWWREMEAER